MTYPVVHDGAMFVPDGKVDPPAAAGPDGKLNCGHGARKPGIISAGFGLISGYTICYDCMSLWERSIMANSQAFTGYLGRMADGKAAFVTWTGDALAKITSDYLGPRRWMPNGGSYRPRYVRAVAPDGSRWHGRGTDSHDLITLRRSRSR